MFDVRDARRVNYLFNSATPFPLQSRFRFDVFEYASVADSAYVSLSDSISSAASDPGSDLRLPDEAPWNAMDHQGGSC